MANEKMADQRPLVSAEAGTLTADEARFLLDYRPKTGDFLWRKGRGGVPAGALAGHLQKFRSGIKYRLIRIDRLYMAHRLAWLIVNGEFPPGILDHANGDSLDNRVSNLRLASYSQNMQNARLRSDNKSGLKGVSWDSTNSKWVARIRVPKGPYKNLGRFVTVKEAHAAYAVAALELYGEFARVV